MQQNITHSQEMPSNAGQLHQAGSRKQRINSIKASLKDFTLISQNKRKVERKLTLLNDSVSETDSYDGVSVEDNEGTHITNFEHTELFNQKYELLEKLGEGSDGVVHRCLKKRSGAQYAAKSLMFQDEHLPLLRYNFMLVKGLTHRNIIRYQAMYLDLKKHLCWLVMELAKAPSLVRTIVTSQPQLKDIVQQILETLYYLHQRSVTHRDIKPENVLYDPVTKQMKLVDFGICRKHRKRGIRMDMLTITGTLYYRAPEMFTGGGYNEKVDIWSTGILIYKLITGHTPFQSVYHNQTIHNIMNRQIEFPQDFQPFSPALKGLLSKMLKKNPKERLSALDCLRDPWFFATMDEGRLPCQVHFSNDPEEEMDLLEGLRSPMLDELDEPLFVRKINGDEYHCFDSDDEGPHQKRHLKKHSKSLTIELHSFNLS